VEPSIRTERRGSVLAIELHRPERLNAFDVPSLLAFRQVLQSAATDRGVRSVLLTGAGRAFCAGGDVAVMDEHRAKGDLPQLFHDLTAELEARRNLLRTTPRPSPDEWLAVTPQTTLDLLASFQRTVIEELLRRAAASAESIGARTLIVSGGVAANSGLRAAAREARLSWPILFPSPGLSTDNAAMIAAAAWPRLLAGDFAPPDLTADPSLALS